MSIDVFHVGLHKTASTWLQKQIFSKLDGINYFDHDFIYDNIILPTHEEFQGIIRCQQFGICEEVNIFSTERLSGNPHSGYYDNYLLAQRIKVISNNAKIVLILREQKSMIVSCYKQYVKSGGSCRLEEYVFSPNEGRTPLFSIKSLEYDVLVKRYFDMFGSDNVLVLPFELLKFDGKRFLSLLSDFIGIDFSSVENIDAKQNIALNDFQISAIRSLNVLGGDTSLNPHQTRLYILANKLAAFVKKYGRAKFFSRYRADFASDTERLVGDRFKVSNQRLRKLVPGSLFVDY